jgi:triacylglycerol lipase
VSTPVVLAHGLFGFERIGVGRWTLATYFRGIPEYLRSLGVRVIVTRVHPTAGISFRARKLGERINEVYPEGPLHIIGHSMGGLDARQLLAEAGWAGRVVSLTTIAAPHRGSSLSVAASGHFGPVYGLLRSIGWDHQGFFDLLPEAIERWRESLPTPPGVPCYTLAGNPAPDAVCRPLRRLYDHIAERDGENDGLVSVSSATGFGTVLDSCPVDHLRQMNWCTGLPGRVVRSDVRKLYRRILDTIAVHDPVSEAVEAMS